MDLLPHKYSNLTHYYVSGTGSILSSGFRFSKRSGVLNFSTHDQ